MTEVEYTEIDQGPGAELCAPMDRALLMIRERRFAAAERVVDAMLASFDVLIQQEGGIPLSVANQEQYDQLRAASPEPENLVPLDFCYQAVMHWKAFLRSEQGDFSGALSTLEQEARIAPTAAAPFVERGFVLNRMSRFSEAKDAYERALDITYRFPLSAPQRPMALRGLGYALVELGDLLAAEKAFIESLELDPDNELAIRELEYIHSLRNQEEEDAARRDR